MSSLKMMLDPYDAKADNPKHYYIGKDQINRLTKFCNMVLNTELKLRIW